MWQVAGWLCAVVAISCKPVPDIAVIQTAYEDEAISGSTLHDKGLQVLQAKCHDAGNSSSTSSSGFLCEVTFTSKEDPEQRLYFDIVAVARADDRWQLKSGLCKR